MGIWSDLPNFSYRGPTVNQGGRMSAYQGVVLHIAEGSFEGTISWQKNPAAQVSSHFITDYDGKIAQMVDTDVVAWTQANGNGRWISIENAGFHTGQFTPAQVEACAQILAHAHRTYGVALQITDDPSTAGRGLGWHGMGGAAWSGHYDCPGPANVALRQPIVDRATQIVNGIDPGGEMGQFFIREPATGSIWLCDFMERRGVSSPAEFNRLLAWGIPNKGDLPATESIDWYGKLFGTGGTLSLTDEELAQVTAAAQAGAEAGAPTHDELAQAAFEGAQRAEDE